MKALVCGGAGYIGSHMVRALERAGHEVLVLDDLSTGHREAVVNAQLVLASLLDESRIDSAFESFRPDIVFHFAALSIVRDSVADPLTYYRNNIAGSINLLASMRRHAVSSIVFSSSAAVYGLPSVGLIDESQALCPINPYGSSKMAMERLLAEAHVAYGIRSVSLRYFNAAGADPEGGIGEAHEPETHLIPNALRAAAEGSPLHVFGRDYTTADGTCVRDYVHVCDLAHAHLLAADYMRHRDGAHVFNLGTGRGSSVMDVVAAVEGVTGRKVEVVYSPRREGDPDRLVATHARASDELGWSPAMSDIESIVRSAWKWHAQRNY
ncbi:UDP-glucose 4-epimerase GalE [Luteibacter sp.]|uniref:UDP-glucose 4-epimerase GalE n=1 Tax=Luteibacter sp. TaxID=1886636 RepID=UPI002F426C2E